MSGIKDKVVAVTGASSGIGEATARLLAEGGARVVLGARRTERLDAIAREIRDRGGAAASCRTDVGQREDLVRLVGTAIDEFGRLDVLVSNAGISKIGPISDLDLDAWSAMIDVNLRGVSGQRFRASPGHRAIGRGCLRSHSVQASAPGGGKPLPGARFAPARMTSAPVGSRICPWRARLLACPRLCNASAASRAVDWP